jgi:hypothetical protein
MFTIARASRRRSRIGAGAAALLLAGWFAATTQAQPVPEVPLAVGMAAGSVQLGKTTVTLKHAYALGPMDMGGKLYQVVLTDAPVPRDAQAKELARGGQPLLKVGKLSGITLLIDDAGFVRNMVPFVGELRGSSMQASAGRLDSFVVTPRGVTGKGRKQVDQTVGQGWSYAASWNAGVTKP